MGAERRQQGEGHCVHAEAEFVRRAFFPTELILLEHDRIALTPEKLEAFRARVEKTQQRSDELRVKLERETGAAAALMKKERVDEGRSSRSSTRSSMLRAS